jgi:hypothetical protein
MRIVKRVISESKYGSFDDEEWYDKDDRFTRVDDMGDDFDEEEFDDFDSLDSKHGHDTKWFGKGDSGRKMFDTYKDKHSKPFKVRTRRGMDEQKGLVTGAKGAGTIKTGSSFGDYAKDFAMGALGLSALFSPEESWKKLVSTYSPLFGVLNTDTGKNLVKVLINGTSAGIIKNMALAASKGDANSFTQSWAQAQKQTKTDLTQLKNAAFKDMKSFGKLLQQSGINEQTIGTTPFKVRTRRGMDEQESNNDGKNFVNKTKETVRTVGNSGEYDYNYIENTIPISKIAKLVNDSITGIQDNEAVVEALFIRISKERDPIAAFKQVRQDYYKQFNSDMMTDIKNDIDINQKYHKESIASLLTKIQKSGNNQSNNNDEESEVVQGGSNDPYEYKFIKRIGNRIYCKYYYRKKYDSNQNRNDAPWIEAKGNGLTSIINKVKFKLPKCMPGDAGPPRYNFK